VSHVLCTCGAARDTCVDCIDAEVDKLLRENQGLGVSLAKMAEERDAALADRIPFAEAYCAQVAAERDSLRAQLDEVREVCRIVGRREAELQRLNQLINIAEIGLMDIARRGSTADKIAAEITLQELKRGRN